LHTSSHDRYVLMISESHDLHTSSHDNLNHLTEQNCKRWFTQGITGSESPAKYQSENRTQKHSTYP